MEYMDIPFEALPPHIQEAIRAHAERQEMEHLDHAHRISGFFESLDGEQLQSLRWIMHQVSNNPLQAAFYEGICSALGSRVRDVCLGCNTNHEDAMRDAGMVSDVPIGHSKEMRTQMAAEYGVTFADEENLIGEVTCINCGKTYVSLDDRMLRSPQPEGCAGCIDKTKFG